MKHGVKTTTFGAVAAVVAVAAAAAIGLRLTSGAAVARAGPDGPLPSSTVANRFVRLGSAPPEASSTASPVPRLADGVVPVLYLHRVEAPPADYPSWSKDRQAAFIDYDLLPSAFAAQLDWLVAHGYTTILPRDLAAHWDLGAQLPPRPVIISFDDGSPSWTRTVLPLLRTHHMVAEFYLTLTAIANRDVTWAQIRQLAQAGMGIGAHDVHHVQLAMLGRTKPAASAAVMWREVHDARLTIGAHIGMPPDSMAYVGGGFNAELVALVRRAGYTSARSILRGTHQSANNRFLLRVVRIGPFDDVVDVVTGELVSGLPRFTRRMADGN